MASFTSYTTDPSSATGFFPPIPQEHPSKSLVDIINSRWGDGWATVRVLQHQKPEHYKVLIADATRAIFVFVEDLSVFSRLVELPPFAQLDVYIRRTWARNKSSGAELAKLQILDVRRPTARCDEIVMSPRVLVYCKDRVFLPYTPDSDDNIINMKFLTKWLINYETIRYHSSETKRQREFVAKYFETITSDITSWPTTLLEWYSNFEWDSPPASPNQCRPLDGQLARQYHSLNERRPREVRLLMGRMRDELRSRTAPVVLNKYTLFGGEASDRAGDGNIETLREAAVRELREETSRASGVSFELQDFEYNVVDTRGELTIKTPVFFVELSEHDFGRLEVREGREHCNHRVAISDVISDLASGESSKYSTLCHMGGSREEWKKMFEMIMARSED